MRLAFSLARQYFDQKKIMRIMGAMSGQMGPQKAQMITQKMLSAPNLMQYDLKLDKGENSITQRNATFMKMNDIVNALPEYRSVLAPYLIRLSDHPDKDEILQQLGIKTQQLDIENAISLVGGGKAPTPTQTGGPQNAAQPDAG